MTCSFFSSSGYLSEFIMLYKPLMFTHYELNFMYVRLYLVQSGLVNYSQDIYIPSYQSCGLVTNSDYLLTLQCVYHQVHLNFTILIQDARGPEEYAVSHILDAINVHQGAKLTDVENTASLLKQNEQLGKICIIDLD